MRANKKQGKDKTRLVRMFLKRAKEIQRKGGEQIDNRPDQFEQQNIFPGKNVSLVRSPFVC